MEIIIKFMGSVGQNLPGKKHLDKTTNLEFPDGAVVKDIFDYFNISVGKGYSAIINNRIAKNTDVLTNGMVVTIVQTAYGG